MNLFQPAHTGASERSALQPEGLSAATADMAPPCAETGAERSPLQLLPALRVAHESGRAPDGNVPAARVHRPRMWLRGLPQPQDGGGLPGRARGQSPPVPARPRALQRPLDAPCRLHGAR